LNASYFEFPCFPCIPWLRAEFIDKDLLKIVEDAFGQVDEARKAELQAKIDEEIKKQNRTEKHLAREEERRSC
jgi:hypothetical protein